MGRTVAETDGGLLMQTEVAIADDGRYCGRRLLAEGEYGFCSMAVDQPSKITDDTITTAAQGAYLIVGQQRPGEWIGKRKLLV